MRNVLCKKVTAFTLSVALMLGSMAINSTSQTAFASAKFNKKLVSVQKGKTANKKAIIHATATGAKKGIRLEETFGDAYVYNIVSAVVGDTNRYLEPAKYTNIKVYGDDTKNTSSDTVKDPTDKPVDPNAGLAADVKAVIAKYEALCNAYKNATPAAVLADYDAAVKALNELSTEEKKASARNAVVGTPTAVTVSVINDELKESKENLESAVEKIRALKLSKFKDVNDLVATAQAIVAPSIKPTVKAGQTVDNVTITKPGATVVFTVKDTNTGFTKEATVKNPTDEDKTAVDVWKLTYYDVIKDGLSTSAVRTKVKAAVEAYNKLSADQKAFVSAEKKILDNEKKILDALDAAKALVESNSFAEATVAALNDKITDIVSQSAVKATVTTAGITVTTTATSLEAASTIKFTIKGFGQGESILTAGHTAEVTVTIASGDSKAAVEALVQSVEMLENATTRNPDITAKTLEILYQKVVTAYNDLSESEKKLFQLDDAYNKYTQFINEHKLLTDIVTKYNNQPHKLSGETYYSDVATKIKSAIKDPLVVSVSADGKATVDGDKVIAGTTATYIVKTKTGFETTIKVVIKE